MVNIRFLKEPKVDMFSLNSQAYHHNNSQMVFTNLFSFCINILDLVHAEIAILLLLGLSHESLSYNPRFRVKTYVRKVYKWMKKMGKDGG